MPETEAHRLAAIENQKALNYLIERKHDFPQWVVTVAFYTALHVVDSILAKDGHHPDDHGVRNGLLKKTKKYEFLWRTYRTLFSDSMIARYLVCNGTGPFKSFADYMAPETIIAQHVNHHLEQLIKSARKMLGNDSFMA